jgi:hypothetical protein
VRRSRRQSTLSKPSVSARPHRRALPAVTGAGLAQREGLDHVALREGDRRHLALAVDGDFEPPR